jgi:hypothetical protein
MQLSKTCHVLSFWGLENKIGAYMIHKIFESWNIDFCTVHMQNVSITLFFLGIRKKSNNIYNKRLGFYIEQSDIADFLLLIFYNTIFFSKVESTKGYNTKQK